MQWIDDRLQGDFKEQAIVTKEDRAERRTAEAPGFIGLEPAT